MAPTTQIATAVAPTDDADKIYELMNGQGEAKEWEPQETSTVRPSIVGIRLFIRLNRYVEIHRLGGVYGPDAAFQTGSALPDVAFLTAARMCVSGELDEKCPVALDLAVEVIAPSESWAKVNHKLREYFAAGVQQVWLVSLELREVHVYDSPKAVTVLGEEDELVSEALLPGFRLRISELFQQPALA